MTAANNAAINPSAGDTFSMAFLILNPAGGVPNLNSPIATIMIFPGSVLVAGMNSVLTKTTPAQQVSGAWVATFAFQSADTMELPPGPYVYQVRIVDGANYEITANGTLALSVNAMG